MGMDVYGKAPTAKVGEYFRNNIWWWRPVAVYVEEMHPDLASRCEHWHTNEGDGLAADQAAALGDCLLADIAGGKAAAWAAIHAADPTAQDYPFSVENLREFAEFCKNSGGFAIT